MLLPWAAAAAAAGEGCSCSCCPPTPANIAMVSVMSRLVGIYCHVSPEMAQLLPPVLTTVNITLEDTRSSSDDSVWSKDCLGLNSMPILPIVHHIIVHRNNALR